MRGDCEVVNSDWGWFIRAQRGDELAWRMLLGQYQTRLSALAFFITRSAVATEDVVQETFVRAINARVKCYTGTVSGFLGTIAYRLAVKEARRDRKHVELDEPDLPETGCTPMDEILRDERDRLVAEAIDSLDEKHRDVLLLRFYGGCSYEEIAGLLEIAVGTVKSRLFHAVKSCRESLRQKGMFR
jgi:RNA polymerase sigma-70 factor, ECF subfamily